MSASERIGRSNVLRKWQEYPTSPSLWKLAVVDQLKPHLAFGRVPDVAKAHPICQGLNQRLSLRLCMGLDVDSAPDQVGQNAQSEQLYDAANLLCGRECGRIDLEIHYLFINYST